MRGSNSIPAGGGSLYLLLKREARRPEAADIQTFMIKTCLTFHTQWASPECDQLVFRFLHSSLQCCENIHVLE